MAKGGNVADADVDVKGDSGQPFAIELFGKIAAIWQLTVAEQSAILGISEAGYLELRDPRYHAHASAEVLRRISYIVKVFKALNTLLSSQEAADTWLRRPNDAKLFCGASALTFILSGSEDALIALHDYLYARLWSC
jgi:uncharacterized protein (DUF2384 family)